MSVRTLTSVAGSGSVASAHAFTNSGQEMTVSPALLGDPDRLAVVGRHRASPELGEGKAHRLAVRPEERGVVDEAGLLLRVVGLARRSARPRLRCGVRSAGTLMNDPAGPGRAAART